MKSKGICDVGLVSTLAACLILSFGTGCGRLGLSKSDADDPFIAPVGSAKNGVAGSGVDASPEASSEASPKGIVEKVKALVMGSDKEAPLGPAPASIPVGQFLVAASEWDKVSEDARRCRAELDVYKKSEDTRAKAEFAKGELSCRASAERRVADQTSIFVSEAESLINETKERLARYMMPAAVVNGECEATLRNGRRFVYVLKGACLNVVTKRVGNDGEVSGLLGAVSSEAIKQGIVSIDCDVGRAHIALLPKPCDTAVGTAGGVTKKD